MAAKAAGLPGEVEPMSTSFGKEEESPDKTKDCRLRQSGENRAYIRLMRATASIGLPGVLGLTPSTFGKEEQRSDKTKA